MLGSKEIRDFTPEKAVFGGYDARSVDMMLDQAADDMEALERENAELRAKLKVMVDKIEEYRRIESGIRQALMTAQGMADKTKKEASEQADQTRTQAQEDAEQLAQELHISEKTMTEKMKTGNFCLEEAKLMIELLDIKNPSEIFFAD